MLLEVGHIRKAHGLRGEVVVALVTPLTERLAPGSVLQRHAGQPLEVVSSRPHQKYHLVRFVGIDDRDGAEALRGTALLAEDTAPPFDRDVLWVHQMVGSTVVSLDGTEHGTVDAVLANPASDLLELDSGALVPLTFVRGWGDDGELLIDPPTGLLD